MCRWTLAALALMGCAASNHIPHVPVKELQVCPAAQQFCTTWLLTTAVQQVVPGGQHPENPDPPGTKKRQQVEPLGQHWLSPDTLLFPVQLNISASTHLHLHVVVSKYDPKPQVISNPHPSLHWQVLGSRYCPAGHSSSGHSSHPQVVGSCTLPGPQYAAGHSQAQVSGLRTFPSPHSARQAPLQRDDPSGQIH